VTMSRRPVDQISALQTREALWEAIRKFQGPFTSRQLRNETRCTVSQVSEYLKGLTAAGILTKERSRSTGQPHRYELANDVGVEAPRVRRDGSVVTQGRGREQMWETMRAMVRFSARDLHVFASTDEHSVALSEAAAYCNTLHQAGYLSKDREFYTLHRRTGPKPPMIQRTKAVFDPNLGEVVWREGGGQ